MKPIGSFKSPNWALKNHLTRDYECPSKRHQLSGRTGRSEIYHLDNWIRELDIAPAITANPSTPPQGGSDGRLTAAVLTHQADQLALWCRQSTHVPFEVGANGLAIRGSP